jgi:SseB protein N-terminal domain
MTDSHNRTIAQSGFEGDDGSADPELTQALGAHGRGEIDRYALYPVLAGKRVLAPVVAILGESEPVESGEGAGLRRDKDSEMALVTLLAADGAKAVPVFTSTDKLSVWGSTSGFPGARPVPVPVERAAAAAIQEEADVLLIDLGTDEQFELAGAALRAFATGRVPTPPDADPDVVAALLVVLRSVPEVADVVESARVGAFAQGAVLELGFTKETDPRTLAEPLRRVAEGIAADPLLRDRLGDGLSIVAAPPPDDSEDA